MTTSRQREDSPHTTGDTGTFVLAVRKDADDDLSNADGDYSPFAVDSKGRLKVVTGATGSFVPADNKTEDNAHASGDTGSFVLGVRNDAAAARTSADGDYSPIATDSAGRVGIADLGGAISVDDNGGSLTVDNAALSVVGGGVESGALRVTLANDSTGLVSVDDNGGSLTVDAPVGTPVFARLSDGAAALTTTGGRLSVDASGVAVPVTDNAGSLTVDNAALTAASAANLSAATLAGASLSALPGQWAVKHEPAAATAAIATKAAGGAGVRHVCNSFTVSVGGTAASGNITVQVKDGTTVIYAALIHSPANDSRTVSVSGLNLYGTANTAMSVETSAPPANVTATASLSGFSIS